MGLSLIPELIIDTHFTERNRLSRLSNAISIHTNRIGVGLSEDTGIIIKNNEIEVIGTGSVTVFNFEELKELKFKVLYSGDKSILNK
jgi:cyanophycinase